MEYFLYGSIKHSFADELIKDDLYKVSTNEQNLVPFPILHVYGKLADLPWQSDSGLVYGSRDLKPFIDHMMGSIRVIYERTNDEIQNITRIIKKSRRIFFLGFGFASENLSALELPQIIPEGQRIYGTVLGYEARERRRIQGVLENSKPGIQVQLEDCDSLTLLRRYL